MTLYMIIFFIIPLLIKGEGLSIADKLEDFPMIYYINLNRSRSRNEYMISTLENLGLLYQRVVGIDGSIENLEQYYIGTWKGDTNSEKGCTLSHIKAIKQYINDIDNKDPYAIIAEDDLSFDFVQYWDKSFFDYIIEAGDEWEILQLCVGNAAKHYFMFEKSDRDDCALAYLIKRSVAVKIINQETKDGRLKITKIEDQYNHADRLIYSYAKRYIYNPSLLTYRDNNDSLLHPNHLKDHIRDKNIHKKRWIEHQRTEL